MAIDKYLYGYWLFSLIIKCFFHSFYNLVAQNVLCKVLANPLFLLVLVSSSKFKKWFKLNFHFAVFDVSFNFFLAMILSSWTKVEVHEYLERLITLPFGSSL